MHHNHSYFACRPSSCSRLPRRRTTTGQAKLSSFPTDAYYRVGSCMCAASSVKTFGINFIRARLYAVHLSSPSSETSTLLR